MRTITHWPEEADQQLRFDKFHAMQAFLMAVADTAAEPLSARAAAILRGEF